MKATGTKTQWAKIGKVHHLSNVGKESIGYSTGCFIKFVNLKTFAKHTFTVNNHKTNGEGVQCFVGHKSNNIFAYTEHSSYPFTFIMSYPKFEKIYVIKDNNIQGHIQITFNVFSLFITLGSFPNYELKVHNWIIGEQISKAKSDLISSNQILRCSKMKPEYMAQLVIGSYDIRIWDLFFACKHNEMVQRKVKFQHSNATVFMDLQWLPDNTLAIVDSLGKVYVVNQDLHLEQIIDNSPEVDSRTFMTCISNGILIYGPNNELRHYKYSKQWILNWNTVPKRNLLNMGSYKSDILYCLNKYHQITLFNISHMKFTCLTKSESMFNDFTIIYPTGEHVVALCNNNRLNIFNVCSGNLVSSYETRPDAISLAGNPEFPYVAVGYKDGIVELISVFKPEKLKILASFYLTKNPITHLDFYQYGKILVTGFLDTGEFFILEGFPGSQITVVASINVGKQIADFTLAVSSKCYRLFLIPVTSNEHIAGSKIIRYCILGKGIVNVKEYEIDDNTVLYQRICVTTKLDRDRVFYAVPIHSKSIHQLEIKRGNTIAKTINIIPTGHLLSHIDLHISKDHAITYGYDGFVIIRNENFTKNLGMSMCHHRRLYGVQKAFIDPHEKHIISLGRDNVLACTDISSNHSQMPAENKLYDLAKSKAFAYIFRRPTIGFEPKGDMIGKCWLEAENLEKIRNEEIESVQKREIILEDVEKIKTVMQNLLTENLNGPEHEMLDVGEFNLDLQLYKSKSKRNDRECERRKEYYTKLILEQDRISQFIKENYIDIMQVPRKLIKAFFDVVYVTNYPLLPENVETTERIRHVEEIKKMYSNFPPGHSLNLWKVYSIRELNSITREPPKILETPPLKNFLDTDLHVSMDTYIAEVGSMSELFINIRGKRTPQSGLITFYQIYNEYVVMTNEILKLKEAFNINFENIRSQKERESKLIYEKNVRQRKIISETNYFSTEKIDIVIEDPEWLQEENPELITQITNEEIGITPYISPNEQAFIDAKAAEAKRLRLLQLADDFREKALMDMMNGVLEIRWEDELKREIPMPKCMIEKNPIQFNEEDLRNVFAYNEKVAFLQSERQKYKILLDHEFRKNAQFIRDTIIKFNNKVLDLYTTKLQMASAIIQEQAILNRFRAFQCNVLQLEEKQSLIKTDIQTRSATIEHLQKIQSDLTEKLSDFKTRLELMTYKDKILEKNFKRDFLDHSSAVQEQATKLYVKRPKVSLKSINDVNILNELSKCIVAGEKSPKLNEEAREYLKSINQLDSAVGISPIVDEHMYSIICKHRRLKIENEVKLKSYYAELAEGEFTILAYSKRIAKHKDKLYSSEQELEKLCLEKLEVYYNTKTQIVCKKGFVELNMHGHLEDFENAVVIPRTEIHEINKKIKDAGKTKMNTMVNNMKFRQKIMMMEWHHMRKKMTINDLKEQIFDLNEVKLTKEIQEYLKKRTMGQRAERESSYETEVEVTRVFYERQIKDLLERIEKLSKQISCLKENNAFIEKEINKINLEISSYKLEVESDLKEKSKQILKSRTSTIISRRNKIEQLQENHNEILMLQTELELLRLRTYPTFQYKMINE